MSLVYHVLLFIPLLEYVINDVAYPTIAEAICGLAQIQRIPNEIANWMIGCIIGIICAKLGQIYNVLDNKIYEHHNQQDETDAKAKAVVKSLHGALHKCVK